MTTNLFLFFKKFTVVGGAGNITYYTPRMIIDKPVARMPVEKDTTRLVIDNK